MTSPVDRERATAVLFHMRYMAVGIVIKLRAQSVRIEDLCGEVPIRASLKMDRAAIGPVKPELRAIRRHVSQDVVDPATCEKAILLRRAIGRAKARISRHIDTPTINSVAGPGDLISVRMAIRESNRN